MNGLDLLLVVLVVAFAILFYAIDYKDGGGAA